jgi:hypothetical protein
MSKGNNSSKKAQAACFGEMMRAFFEALGEIYDGAELKEKAREFGVITAKSAKAFESGLADKDVETKFSDLGKQLKTWLGT